MDLSRLVIIAVVAAVNLGLAFTVYLRNKRSASNRAFAAAVVLIVCWLSFAYLSDQTLLHNQALLLNQLTIAAAILMGAFLLRFALIFPSREGTLPLLWNVNLSIGVALAVVTLLTPAVVAGVRFRAGGTDVVAGPGLPVLLVWAIIGVISLVVSLAKKYRRAAGRERVQLRFMLLGVAAFAVASLTFGLILPTLTGSYEWADLNTFSTLLLVTLTAYAIVKHRFMDIRLVVLRGASYAFLVFAAGAGLVWLAFLAEQDLSARLHVQPQALFVLGSLAAVFAFQPVRRGLEHITDGLFYQRTYVPTELLNRLGSSMTSTLDECGLAELVASELAQGMRLTFAAVLFEHAGTLEIAATEPWLSHDDAQALLDLSSQGELVVADEAHPDSDGYQELVERDVRVLAPIGSGDELLGAVVLGPKRSGESFSAQDVRFLEVVMTEAAIAMRNAHLFDEKHQRVRELTALNQLAFALGSNIELDAVLEGALEQVVEVTSADSGSIMLLDKEGVLTIAASIGIDEKIAATTRIPVGEGIAGWVAACKEPLTLEGSSHSEIGRELLRDDLSSAICAPVMSKDSVIGVLSVSRKRPSESFTSENMHVVTSFAGQLGVAVENARLYTDLENTFLGTISALAAAVDAKDPYTAGHSSEVTTLAVSLAEALGLEPAEIQTIRIAATLHDIGKIGIDGAILLKPGRLTDAEREMINRHPAIGADILAPLEFLREAVPMVLFHHERYGGGGYPSGISGEAIPFGARIIAVADAFNAMVSDRPYREGLSLEAAMREVRVNAGTQFDPVVADTFLKLLDDAALSRKTEVPASMPADWPSDIGRL